MDISKNISILIELDHLFVERSAVAATAPIIEASEEEVAQAISVIFLFNVLAAIIFPALGSMIGFSQILERHLVFLQVRQSTIHLLLQQLQAWDSLYNLGTATLDKAITVKLTRTLAIIPISLFLAYIWRQKNSQANSSEKVSIKSIFPFLFIFHTCKFDYNNSNKFWNKHKSFCTI